MGMTWVLVYWIAASIPLGLILGQGIGNHSTEP